MTRFARAKGSKASNERVPEDATSWQEMKQQLIVNHHKNDVNDGEKPLSSGSDRVKSFELPAAKTEWSVFPDVTEKNNVRQPDQTISKKIKKLTKAKKPNNAPTEDSNKGEAKDLKKPNEHVTESTEEQSITSEKKIKGKKKKKLVTPKTNDNVKSSEADISNGTSKGKKRKNRDNLSETSKPKKVKKAENEEISGNLSKSTVKNKNQNKAAPNKFNRRNDSSQQSNNNDQQINKNDRFGNKNRQFSKANNAQFSNKNKVKKERNGDFKRRKPVTNTVFINGVEIETTLYEGFPVKLEDYERIEKLKADMKDKGIPLSEINKALKLERRRAEKSLSRAKKSVCFNCRRGGHNISECPNLKSDNPEMMETGICFKCGSTQHTHFQCRVVHDDSFKFAQCFICKERGHISRQCPDNRRGIYPKGGACKLCGDVTHLRQDCPKRHAELQESKFVLDTIGERIEDLDKEPVLGVVKQVPVKPKVIKF